MAGTAHSEGNKDGEPERGAPEGDGSGGGIVAKIG